MLEKVCTDLKEGARLGVSEDCRVPTTITNAPSALDHGEEVTDALIYWQNEKYAIGPFDENKKNSGLMCKMKPNGKAWIFVNLSKEKPVSVNKGIDKKKFPTAIFSTTAWIRIMLRCGKNCRFSECDWAVAYNQIRVNPEDVRLQGFSWLGKIFFEIRFIESTEFNVVEMTSDMLCTLLYCYSHSCTPSF